MSDIFTESVFIHEDRLVFATRNMRCDCCAMEESYNLKDLHPLFLEKAKKLTQMEWEYQAAADLLEQDIDRYLFDKQMRDQNV